MKNNVLGDRTFIEDIHGNIFVVVGNVHPPEGIVALPAYIISEQGNRRRGNLKYMKVPAEGMMQIASTYFSRYLTYSKTLNRKILVLPKKYIARIYDPRKKLSEILREGTTTVSPVKKDLITLIDIIRRHCKVPLSDLGIEGSILVDLATEESDLDLCVYGRSTIKKLRRCINKLLGEIDCLERFKTKEQLTWLWERRKDYSFMNYDELIFHETRKMQGLINGRKFLFIGSRKYEEMGKERRDVTYVPLENVTIKGKVVEDKDVPYNPSIFTVKLLNVLEGCVPNNVKLIEVWSYLPNFSDQVRSKEIVIVRGRLEEILNRNNIFYGYRILISPWDDYICGRYTIKIETLNKKL